MAAVMVQAAAAASVGDEAWAVGVDSRAAAAKARAVADERRGPARPRHQRPMRPPLTRAVAPLLLLIRRPMPRLPYPHPSALHLLI
eukprot:6613071-Prymnesium_polylepis.1